MQNNRQSQSNLDVLGLDNNAIDDGLEEMVPLRSRTRLPTPDHFGCSFNDGSVEPTGGSIVLVKQTILQNCQQLSWCVQKAQDALSDSPFKTGCLDSSRRIGAFTLVNGCPGGVVAIAASVLI